MPTMTSIPVSLPGFGAPAVGFEQPFEMLEACHERVRRSLGLLRRIVAHIDAQGHDAQSRAATADVLRYFDVAGPQHHEYEERHVFPALAEHPDDLVRAAVEQLKSDHLRMSAQWQRLRAALITWRDADAPPPIDTDTRALIDEYVVSYERHIPLEEAVAYPAARPLFSDADIARIGAEMAARRQSGGR